MSEFRPQLNPGKKMRLPVSGIKEELFVRRKIDEDHVLQLAALYEAHVDMPPIVVTQDWVVVDGRHRLHAAQVCDMKEIVCDVIETPVDQGDLLVHAFSANLGGALPPMQQDITYTIIQLLQNGWSGAKICRSLPYPHLVAKNYVHLAQNAIRKATINRAVESVRDGGLTVAQAATKFSLPEGEIKERLGSKKKKLEVELVKGTLSLKYRGFSRTLSSLMTRVFDDSLDGKLDERAVWGVLEHMTKLQLQHQRNLTDLKERFAAMVDDKNGVLSTRKAPEQERSVAGYLAPTAEKRP